MNSTLDEPLVIGDGGGLTIATAKDSENVPADPLEFGVRRLLPIEAERLQGFPDGWTEFGVNDGELVAVSDSARYRMLGNAVAVPVVAWIAERLVRVDERVESGFG